MRKPYEESKFGNDHKATELPFQKCKCNCSLLFEEIITLKLFSDGKEYEENITKETLHIERENPSPPPSPTQTH